MLPRTGAAHPNGRALARRDDAAEHWCGKVFQLVHSPGVTPPDGAWSGGRLASSAAIRATRRRRWSSVEPLWLLHRMRRAVRLFVSVAGPRSPGCSPAIHCPTRCPSVACNSRWRSGPCTSTSRRRTGPANGVTSCHSALRSSKSSSSTLGCVARGQRLLPHRRVAGVGGTGRECSH